MGKTATSESGTRSRTRRAILSAAASVLARNRMATLADIAEAADVGRSTLHRYFADRDELINAVIADSYQAIRQSVQDAAIEQGPPLDAMRRLVAGMVDAGDRLLFLFGDSRVLEGFDSTAEPDPVSQSMIDLITRGQAENVFDQEVSAAWIQHVLWALVYTGCDAAGKRVLPRHGVTSTVIRTFENGVYVRPVPGRDLRDSEGER